jgi:hypothetical protein
MSFFSVGVFTLAKTSGFGKFIISVQEFINTFLGQEYPKVRKLSKTWYIFGSQIVNSGSGKSVAGL